MRARRFNQQGLSMFAGFVEQARADWKAGQEVGPVPAELLWNNDFGVLTNFELPDGDPVFETKLAIGEFVAGIVPDWAYEEARMDAGFWSCTPRWTAENRPLTDTAKAAIVGGRARLVSSTSWPPRRASRCGLSCASFSVRTSARGRDAVTDQGAP